jgi:hypothetical protein
VELTEDFPSSALASFVPCESISKNILFLQQAGSKRKIDLLEWGGCVPRARGALKMTILYVKRRQRWSNGTNARLEELLVEQIEIQL